jgi:DNA invertase Pin-like site-specific DNA recombinase
MAVIAQAERQRISDNTKAALAAAKARGVKLGHRATLRATKATARVATQAAQVAAKSRAEELRDVVMDARANGCTSLRQVADHLNGLGITTPRGGRWAAASVARLMGQLAA